MEERGIYGNPGPGEWRRWRPSGAWTPLDPPCQPGGEGTGLEWDRSPGPAWDRSPGPPSTTALSLSLARPVVQKGCFPTRAGRRGVPARHSGQTRPRAKPRRHQPTFLPQWKSVSPGANSKARDKESKTDFCTCSAYICCSGICGLLKTPHLRGDGVRVPGGQGNHK